MTIKPLLRTSDATRRRQAQYRQGMIDAMLLRPAAFDDEYYLRGYRSARDRLEEDAPA